MRAWELFFFKEENEFNQPQLVCKVHKPTTSEREGAWPRAWRWISRVAQDLRLSLVRVEGCLILVARERSGG